MPSFPHPMHCSFHFDMTANETRGQNLLGKDLSTPTMYKFMGNL